MPPSDDLTPIPHASVCAFHEGCSQRLEGVRTTTEEHGRHLTRVAVEAQQMKSDIADHEERIRGAEKTLTKVGVVAGVVASIGSAALTLLAKLLGG